MSRQIICVLSTFFVISSVLSGPRAQAYGDYGGSPSGGGSDNPSGIAETQQRRASERFDIINWIRGEQQIIASQNARYGYSKGSALRSFADIVLDYRQDSGSVTQDSVTLGKDYRSTGRLQFLMDDLFVRGNRTRSLNIDLGAEGFFGQTTNFQADTASTQLSHAYNEMGGALLLRPVGRSSQDTSLTAKIGYMNVTETGLWQNTQTQYSMYGTYLGAQAKIYLLPFMGLDGEYMATLEQPVDALQAKWKMQRFTYGAFIEVYLIKFGAYLMSTEMDLTPNNGGAPVKEVYSGGGLSATMYF